MISTSLHPFCAATRPSVDLRSSGRYTVVFFMPYAIPYVLYEVEIRALHGGYGGFAGGKDIEVVPEAGDGEDTLDRLRGGGEAERDPLLLEGVLGAHEG